MSYVLPPSVTSLLAAIDAGDYLTPSAREAAIRQAGGPDFVQLALIRKWLDASGGTVVGGLTFKGSTDASGNPNYAASSLKGDAYLITVAGKIGGASGKVVEVGDLVIANADNAGGTEASVGTSWFVLQANITGITATGLALVRASDAAAALAVVGGLGGSTGSTDNAILRADGTGGVTSQSSAATIDDLGRIQTTRVDTSQPTIAIGAGLQAGLMTNADSLVAFVGTNTFLGFASSFHGLCAQQGLALGWVPNIGAAVEEKFLRVAAYVISQNFGIQKPCVIKTTAYTVDATPGDYTLVGNHATTPFTLTMIAASTNTGRILVFKNKGAAAVTVDATALGQIFTTTLVNTVVLNTGDSITLQSDGATWLLY